MQNGGVREAIKKYIGSVSILIPPSDLPPPSTVSVLCYFFTQRFFCIIGFVWYAVKQRKRRMVKFCQINGERVNFDGQINQKIYEIMSWELIPGLFWGFLEPNK